MCVYVYTFPYLIGGTGTSLPGTGGKFEVGTRLLGVGSVSLNCLLLLISGEAGRPSGGAGMGGRGVCSKLRGTGLGVNLSPVVGALCRNSEEK